MRSFVLLISLIIGLTACTHKVIREDKRKFKVGDCFALISVSEVMDMNDRYLAKPKATIFYDISFKITSLDDDNRLYWLVYNGGPYNGLMEAKDYDFADANYQKLNCDGKYE